MNVFLNKDFILNICSKINNNAATCWSCQFVKYDLYIHESLKTFKILIKNTCVDIH